jgi:uncharacterized cupredoxin-like copper-binding protein
MKRCKLYVGLVLVSVAIVAAGCGGDDNNSSDTTAATTETTTTDTTTTDTDAASAGEATTLTIAADPGGALKFDKTKLSAPAGKVTISMDNPSSLPHAVEIEGNGVEEEGETVQKGGVSKATAELKPGTYEFYCPVAGHKEAGMEGELEVK